jgi:hypothetical protein
VSVHLALLSGEAKPLVLDIIAFARSVDQFVYLLYKVDV